MEQFQHQQDVLEIAEGASMLRFAPRAGGRLLSWDMGGDSIIHWPDQADWSELANVHGGNPLLFPFCGRHRVDGQIGRWRDRQATVREVPMHGFARYLPFRAVLDADRRGVRMTLTDGEITRKGYPFAFSFEAEYRLVDERTLNVGLTTVNTGTAPLPYNAGHHFYFSLPRNQRAATALELPGTQRRYEIPDSSIGAPEHGERHYMFDDERLVNCLHCLDSARRTPVRIVLSKLKRTITIDLQCPGSIPWYAVVTWTEGADSDFYCVEPWLGLPDAIHNGLGLRWLEPGEGETAQLRIKVGALD